MSRQARHAAREGAMQLGAQPSLVKSMQMQQAGSQTSLQATQPSWPQAPSLPNSPCTTGDQ